MAGSGRGECAGVISVDDCPRQLGKFKDVPIVGVAMGMALPLLFAWTAALGTLARAVVLTTSSTPAALRIPAAGTQPTGLPPV